MSFYGVCRHQPPFDDWRNRGHIHQNCRVTALKMPSDSMRLSYAANASRFFSCHWAIRAAFTTVSRATSKVAERLTGCFGLRFKMCSIWTNSRCAGTGRVSSNQSHHRIRRWIFCVIPGGAQPRPGNKVNSERTILGRGKDRRQNGPLYRLTAARGGEMISAAASRPGEKSQHAGAEPLSGGSHCAHAFPQGMTTVLQS